MDESLKILYISHYFPPEVNAPAVRVSEMSDYWAERGADVTILTCFPNHPAGVIPDEYKGLWRCREKRGKIKVIRTYVYAAPNKGFLKRILNYLSFMASSFVFGSSLIGKPDIVIATSPQFFVGIAGYIISRIKRSKFIFEVRDLWPEEIVAVGALKNKLAIRFLEAIEMFLYKKADLVVTVAKSAMETLKDRGVPESKLALVPNGVDIDFIHNYADGLKIRERLNLQDKFVLGYIGTHGMAHRLDTVLEAASILQNHDNFRFLLVGDGAEKHRLVDLAARMNLKNVIFHDQVGRDRIPEFYGACDICLVPLKNAGIFTRNIPSKIYEIMAAGRPIIISANGESRKMVADADAGIGANPEDADDLAEKIRHLFNHRETCLKMGRNGYAFVLANSSRRRLAEYYFEILESLGGKKKAASNLNRPTESSENKYGAKKKVKTLA
jgi:glycosyltransferase involved in cell wall biosynthesis